MKTFASYLESTVQKDSLVAHQECLEFTNSNGKRFVLLYKDVLDCLRIIWKRGFKIEKDFDGNWDYEEDKYRRVLGEVLKEAGANSVVTNLGSQTSNTVKSLDLYAGYLLRKNPMANGKMPFFLSHRQLSGIFSLKDEFKKWLLFSGKSEKSAESYSSAISPTISKLVDYDVFSISSNSDFVLLRDALSNKQEFISLDTNGNQMYSIALKHYEQFINSRESVLNEHPSNATLLPKPFLLLAGISGTGKTRFVREQAKGVAAQHGMTKGENHCLVPVRPDWHEPSDLLGYISRIGNGGARYVTTDLLRFIVAAWKHVAQGASTSEITQKELNTICPYWLCLDEMNLAPVEQYFADYLSILETRSWKDECYSCEPLLKPAVIQQQLDETGRNDLWANLGLSDDDSLSSGLRDYFLENGISLPPNLIVAGTVNMDETTHGFSRKVIDRALTLDFGEFFPNIYERYFEHDKVTSVKLLGFPHISEIMKKDDLAGVAADPEGGKTIAFLTAVNVVLTGTPFELAYRALNEVLLAVVCFNPADESELQAVWDDFLMMKVLPRIEGDAEKLASQDEESLLTRLTDLLKDQFSKIIMERRDLLNQSAKDGSAVNTVCRSLKKLEWMQKRLTDNGFTSFWP